MPELRHPHPPAVGLRPRRGLVALAAVVLAATAALGQDRGYQPRGCGFDMNRDGIVGAAEDCNVCNGLSNDGDADGSGADTVYVSCEGDPGAPYQFFTPGADNPGCGTAAAPCRTIGYAFATVADGPADGNEDFVCFRNRCVEENLSPRPNGGGVVGTYTRHATTSEARDWLLPSDPVMLVGWDVDHDGVYPPVDQDHAAILEPPPTCPGTPNQGCAAAPVLNPDDNRHRFHQKITERTIFLANHLDNVELAHFEARDYGRFTLTENSGFFDLHYHPDGNRPSESSDYIYVHDITTSGLNRDSNFNSTTSAINFFSWVATWVAFENMEFLDNGHWFARGGGGDGPADYGPFRFDNLTVTLDACIPPPAVTCDWQVGPTCPQGNVCLTETGCEPTPAEVCTTRDSTTWKIWGYYSGFEVLDSVFDVNLRSHPTLDLDGLARGVDIAQCSQDWVVRNNELIDFNSAVEVSGASEGYCEGTKAADGVTILDLDARPVTDITVDRNTIHHPSRTGAALGAITLLPGGAAFPDQTVGDVTIANNMISSDDGLSSCIRVEAGHSWDGSDPAYPVTEPPGAVRIFNNSCYGPITGPTAIAIGNPWGLNEAELQQDIVVRNNLVGGKGATAANIATTYAPAGSFDVGGNVWDPDGDYRFNQDNPNARLDLAGWIVASGDTGAKECVPQLAESSGVYSNGDPAAVGGNLHLGPADTCAQGAGQDLSTLEPTARSGEDLDREARPQGDGWDAGADEVAPRPLSEPPLRFGGAPTGLLPFGTTTTNLVLHTDQDATCAWSTTPGTPFGAQTPFSNTGATLHTSPLSGLQGGSEHAYFVRCRNTNLVENADDYPISFAVTTLGTNLVAHWPLDETTGCTAASATGGDGGDLAPTCPGDSPSWSPGIVAGGLTFDGSNDYVEVPHAEALAFTSSFSVAAWIRPTSFGDGDYGRIAAKQRYVGGFGPGWSLYLGNQPGGSPAGRRTLCANIDVDLGCGDDNAITLDVWQHAAVVFDDVANTATLYVNGLEQGTFVADAALRPATVPLLLGDRDGLTRSFAGDIDDVRLWSRALSAAEVVQLAIAPGQPPVRSNGSPSGNLAAGTTNIVLALETNEPSTCRWSTTPATAYEAMTETLTPDVAGTSHTAPLAVVDNTLYRAFVRCEDGENTVNQDDFEISFYVGFHPSELDGVLFFVESRHGLTLATGTTIADFVNYCEPSLFPGQLGCVRRWEDQSGYTGTPGVVGRDFGQDDVEKPVVLANCINGLPCVQGGPATLSPNFVQGLSLEIELPHQPEAPGALSAYLLVRPVAQVADYAPFGFAGTTLRHRVVDDTLMLQVDSAPSIAVSTAGAFTPDAWHLVELHRDGGDALSVVVDGEDKTLASPVLSGGFDFRFLLSVSRVETMHGQVAAFLLIDGELSASAKEQVRTYFGRVFLGAPAPGTVFSDGFESGTSDAWSTTVP